ncbi:MAG: bifunctional 4-hydroxy-2-oxoglutarate aldolase/2-dehydro-3-deoxy-phosphogluconate aldolase [Planctomycetota bacterium]|jgi:2-dehydro-3-deoxyphosphogluconate aldolase/(4S)-4-hydroxy-2-oxoglutarate aldolase
MTTTQPTSETTMWPAAFVQFLSETRASAILRTDHEALAAEAMEAAIRAGFRVIEFTLTMPNALELISEFRRREGLAVGAGTVLATAEAEAAVAAGAQFLVSPVVDESVLAAAKSLNVAMMPGTYTPTEMLRAHRAGAPLCKLFPGPGTGPAFVRSVLAPMPFLRIVPTNGVTESNAAAYLDAGAFAVGFTTALFDAEAMAAGDLDAIEHRAASLLQAVAGAAGA